MKICKPGKGTFGICIVMAVCFLFTGCKSWDDTGSSQEPAATNTQSGMPQQQTPGDVSNYAMNPLTGIQNMDKKNSGKRPLAIMISNIKKATPQSGITECDLYYEAEAEGGITRIMGLFADPAKIPVIGPIRSAREYYVDIAVGYNAIFAHYGTSSSAKTRIGEYAVNNLDGMYLSSTFWRDPTRKKNQGAEHSALTSGEKLTAAIQQKKYKMDTGINGGQAFQFYSQDQFTAEGTKDCSKVSAKFSGSTTAVFQYDAAARLYAKSQFNAPHVDDKGKQIQVTNVIVLHTPIKIVSNEGHLSVDLSSGKGYYISGGKSKEIKWSKGDVKNPMKYYELDGTELTVNAGKTYVCIVRSADYITLN